MLGHVAAVGTGIALAAQHMKKDVFHRHPERVGDGLFAVIRKEPVVAGLHQHDRPDLGLLVTARRSQERNFSLPGEDLQTFLDVVDPQHLLKEVSKHPVWNTAAIAIRMRRFAADRFIV